MRAKETTIVYAAIKIKETNRKKNKQNFLLNFQSGILELEALDTMSDTTKTPEKTEPTVMIEKSKPGMKKRKRIKRKTDGPKRFLNGF